MVFSTEPPPRVFPFFSLWKLLLSSNSTQNSFPLAFSLQILSGLLGHTNTPRLCKSIHILSSNFSPILHLAHNVKIFIILIPLAFGALHPWDMLRITSPRKEALGAYILFSEVHLSTLWRGSSQPSHCSNSTGTGYIQCLTQGRCQE